MSHPTELLSDYVDDTLGTRDREDVARHLEHCGDCTRVLDELRGVVARARALGPIEPDRDLWPGIAARIGESAGSEAGTPAVGDVATPNARPERTAWWRMPEWTFSMPQLAAACVVIAMLSGGAVWWIMRGGPAAGGPGTASPVATTAGSVDALPVTGYEQTIQDLEATLAGNRERLDPGTIAVIEQNLAIIDAAIEDSRDALASDPASNYLYRNLNRQMQQKVDLLRQANVYAFAGN